MSKTLVYRWIVFLLAAFYVLRMVVFGGYEDWGGPFRYLTNWALMMSCLSAGLMLAYQTGQSGMRADTWVGATAVINAMVVFLYWRLYFADPTSVTKNGQLGVWWQEYYLHALGPVLQWIDALFLHRSFRRVVRSALALIGTIAAYVGWSELLVSPRNTEPVGTVTAGLPYPFLNNLDWAGRQTFYVTNAIVALCLLIAFAGVAWLIRRATAAAPAAREKRH